MLRVFAVFALLIVAFVRPGPATAADTCAGEYLELAANLDDMRTMHRRWALFLDANPSYLAYNPALTDALGSAAQQWGWVEHYDQRLTAVAYLARGDRIYVPWLLQALEASRAWHQAEAAKLYANPAHPMNTTADGAAGQAWMVAVYEWRIGKTYQMLRDCA